MPVVILWAHCIARPDADGARFDLGSHLEAVALGCGKITGLPEERLGFLAGLLHDAAKAALEWQRYIRGERSKGPPHAPLGAALFAFWADDLVPRWTGDDRALKRCLFDLALDWTRVVYDHHGEIHNLEPEPPWRRGTGGTGMPELFTTIDHSGLVEFIRRFFPEASDLAGFQTWLDKWDARWRSRQFDRDGLLRDARRMRPGDDVPLAAEGLRLPRLAATLVFADRSHAAEWDRECFLAPDADAAAGHLQTFLQDRVTKALAEGANPGLVCTRSRLNQAALAEYRTHPGGSIFALLLPTGFGKTLTGLTIALEACRTGRCRRIIYVAPYLSILSQAAREIAEATGMEIFVHHHLTAATLEDHQPYDPVDTWQTPLLATTFNQLFRALFPGRAQQCLRRPALEQAFVLVDEPQIINVAVWNLFLRALAVACREQGCQALLMTATLPPADTGLGTAPVDLVSRETIGALPAPRYVIHSTAGEWNAARAAQEARKRFETGKSVGVILNTVRDACDVFHRVVGKGDPRWRFLAAAMMPGHKAKIIAELRRMVKQKQPAGVICTQVLEAGVDISFQSLLRAQSVFPSVVQAAGRANRHGGSEEPAEVVVFDYRRDEGRPTRQFIYKSENACRFSDELLAEMAPLTERDVPSALVEYFRRLWAVEPATACLERFEKSARGEWSALAGLAPFDGDDAWRVNVFVPYLSGDRFLSRRMALLLEQFAPAGPHQLLQRYESRDFRRTLTFRDRKRLAALVQQFTVALPKKVAERVADRTGMDWLWVLSDPSSYSMHTGLAHLLGDVEDDPSCCII